MIVQLNEVTNLTEKMVPYGMGRFGVSEDVQRAMLASFLNVAEATLKTRAEVKAQTGLDQPNTLPRVVLTYSKVTKAKARVEGQDYAGVPGVAFDTHLGQVVKVARNKQGRLYFTVRDENRAGDKVGFTAVRLEGVRTFAFANPKVQKQFLEAAQAVAV
jgi:hypothetical protein